MFVGFLLITITLATVQQIDMRGPLYIVYTSAKKDPLEFTLFVKTSFLQSSSDASHDPAEDESSDLEMACDDVTTDYAADPSAGIYDAGSYDRMVGDLGADEEDEIKNTPFNRSASLPFKKYLLVCLHLFSKLLIITLFLFASATQQCYCANNSSVKSENLRSCIRHTLQHTIIMTIFDDKFLVISQSSER